MSNASENAPTTSNVFTFIGFSLMVSLDSKRFHRERFARTKHGTHSARVGAVRIRTVVKQRRACQEGLDRLWVCEFSNEPAAKTWFVEPSRLVDTAQVQMLAHRTGHALS